MGRIAIEIYFSYLQKKKGLGGGGTGPDAKADGVQCLSSILFVQLYLVSFQGRALLKKK